MAAAGRVSSGCKEYHHRDVKEGLSLEGLVSDQDGPGPGVSEMKTLVAAVAPNALWETEGEEKAKCR